MKKNKIKNIFGDTNGTYKQKECTDNQPSTTYEQVLQPRKEPTNPAGILNSIESGWDTLRRSFSKKKNQRKVLISNENKIESGSFPYSPDSPVKQLTSDLATVNDYEVIDDLKKDINSNSALANSTDQTSRPGILNPKQEQQLYLDNINKTSELREILHVIHSNFDLFNQIKLMWQFSNGNDVEDFNFSETTKKVDESIDEIIKNEELTKDIFSVRNLALKYSFYLFKHELWDNFMVGEGHYETIENDYEVMDCINLPVEPVYVPKQDNSTYMTMTQNNFFGINSTSDIRQLANAPLSKI